MSDASEWARRHAQTEATQPKYECEAFGYYHGLMTSDEKEEARALQKVGEVAPGGGLQLTACVIEPGDACAFARWILATFSNPATFPA